MHLFQNTLAKHVPYYVLVALLFASTTAFAVPGTFTWTGAGGNSLWTNPNNWDGVPAIDHEPNGYPNAADHAVSIGLGTGTILIGAADSVKCYHLDQTAGTLNILGRLKIYGNYNLNFPTLTAGTGVISLAGNALTGIGTAFGTSVSIGSLLFLPDKTLVGYVATTPSATSATVVQMAGLNPSAISTTTSFSFIAPAFVAVGGGATISTNIGGELTNIVTGGPFTDAMRGRMILSGGQAVGVVMAVENSTRLRLTSAALVTKTSAAFSLSAPVAEVGTGAITCAAGSRVSFLANVSQNIPAKNYAQLFVEDARVASYVDIFKGPYTTAGTISISEQLRQKHQVRQSSLMGAIVQLATSAAHLTWIGDNNTTTAWPLGTYATTESNPYSIVYSGQVDRYILNMAASTVYNAVDFTYSDTQYRNFTLVGSANASTVVFPSKSILVINGNLVVGTVTSYPTGNTGIPGRRLTLGNSGSGSADAVQFTIYGNYSKIAGGGIIARDGFVGYNRTRLKVRGTGAMNQGFFDEIAAPAGLRLTEFNIDRPNLVASYAGDADTYDMTSGTITLTGTTRACDNIAIRSGGVSAPQLNLGATTTTVAQVYAQQAGTVTCTASPGTVNVGGTWLQNDGAFNGGTATVNYTGFFPGNITVGPTATCSYYNWVINKTFGSAVTIGSGSIRVLNGLSLPISNTGMLSASSGNITLASSASGTAHIAQVLGGTLDGNNFTVERYIPINSGASNFWMELGTPLTDAIPTGYANLNATAFPAAAANFYTYNEQDTTSFIELGVRYNWNGWKRVTNIVSVLPNGRGFRAKANAAMLSSGRTFSATGTPAVGNVDVTTTRTTVAPGGANGGGWNFLANPYACAIDFESASLVKPAGMNNAFWVWDGQFDRYRVFVGASGTDLGSIALNVTGGASANLIASGQGFWVKVTSGAGGTFGFREAAKSTSDASFYRTASTGFVKMALRAPNGRTDEAALRFNPRTTLGFDAFADATKLAGSGANLSLLPLQGVDLSVHTQPIPATEQRIPLKVAAKTVGSYTLTFTGLVDGLPAGLHVALLDRTQNRTLPIAEGTVYTTTLTQTDIAHPDARFVLILQPNSVTSTHPTENLNLTLSPNPANETVQIQGMALNAHVFVRDVTGKIIQTTQTSTLHVATWPKGIYTVTVTQDGQTQHQRLVVE